MKREGGKTETVSTVDARQKRHGTEREDQKEAEEKKMEVGRNESEAGKPQVGGQGRRRSRGEGQFKQMTRLEVCLALHRGDPVSKCHSAGGRHAPPAPEGPAYT